MLKLGEVVVSTCTTTSTSFNKIGLNTKKVFICGNGTYDADPSSNSGLKLYPGLCSIERISKCNFVTMVG